MSDTYTVGRKAKNPLAALANAARDQLKRAEALGKSLDVRMKTKQTASDAFTLDEDFRRDFAAVTAALQHAGKSLVTALDSNKKDLAGLSEAQLDAQFAVEIVKAATTLSDEDWDRMCAARAKAKGHT